MRRFIREWGPVVGMLTILGGGPYLGSYYVQRDHIRPYVESNIEQIMRAQEERLGIKYTSMPNLRFPLVDKDTVVPVPLLTIPALARYDAESDTIVVYTSASTTMDFIFYGDFTKHIKQTLDHELGHFLTDKLSESLGMGNWKIDEDEPYLVAFGEKLIGEGIAMYFEHEMNPEDIKLESYVWEGNVEELSGFIFFNNERGNAFYNGGYQLVKPIIDEYGINGIEYLIRNPPVVENLEEIPGYQKEVLEALGTQDSKSM